MTTSWRADRAGFRFSGPDAHKLLNDVVTGPIPNGGEGAGRWALLSPQGKILAEGLSGWAEDGWWLDVHQSVADDFFKRMKMYRLRANVVIEDMRATHAIGWSEQAVTGAIAHQDRLGWRMIAPVETTTAWLPTDTDFARTRIAAGIAELGQDFAANETFAHDMGLDLLDGIDFSKGCYVGQEVVSRMKHRGTARRRPIIVSGIDALAGSAVIAGGRDAGVIGRVVDGKAIALLRLDRINDPQAVTIAGQPVSVALPDWASYQFGETASED